MMHDFKGVHVFLRCGATDMRKQINGLAVIAEQEMKKDVFGRNLFLFCNKSRKHLKILYWDKNGFCLWLKRLEKDRFPWPKDRQGVRQLSHGELRMLLAGIDFFNAHQRLDYRKIS